MKEYSMIEHLINSDLTTIRDQFRAKGFDLRFVGGCVRDVLANIQLNDIDLCTDADPSEQKQIYDLNSVQYIPTGVSHGTYTVVLNNKIYEITSLRQDVSTDGRRATVAYTKDWLMDLARRDFTINAMQLTFDGELVDPYNGKQDLNDGIIRFVGNPIERIREDYLRVLRWYRFIGKFGTVEASPQIQLEQTDIKGIENLSRERIWQEFQKILALENFVQVIDQMSRDRVLNILLQNTLNSMTLSFLSDQQFTSRTTDSITRLIKVFGTGAVIILASLKASNADIRKATQLSVWMNSNPQPKRLLVSGFSWDMVKQYCILAGYDNFDLSVLEAWDPPKFPVNGNDVLALGIQSGPSVGHWLELLRNHWINSNFTMTKEQLLEINI